jgi:hypothetical protein
VKNTPFASFTGIRQRLNGKAKRNLQHHFFCKKKIPLSKTNKQLLKTHAALVEKLRGDRDAVKGRADNGGAAVAVVHNFTLGFRVRRAHSAACGINLAAKAVCGLWVKKKEETQGCFSTNGPLLLGRENSNWIGYNIRVDATTTLLLLLLLLLLLHRVARLHGLYILKSK